MKGQPLELWNALPDWERVNSIVESGDILSISCNDAIELLDDVEEDVDERDDGDEGHRICSNADVPITGRSSVPEDAVSSAGEYRNRSTSNEVTGVGIKASMVA